MAQFFFSYGLFALKALTLVLLLGALVTFFIAAVSRPTSTSPYEIELIKINDQLKFDKEVMSDALMDDAALALSHKVKKADRKAKKKRDKKSIKKAKKAASTHTEELLEEKHERKRVFVLDFDGDLAATAVTNMRREITAVLSVATEKDEVVLRLESGGGMVHSYGLAASQLDRIKAKNVPLTICVDKVAASGGYMMACVADLLLAAPFAVIGSIGVVAQIPNFNRLLRKHDVDIELLTAGKHKRTLTLLGENTEEGRQKFRDDLEDTHLLFKEFVHEKRPSLDIEKVATGEVWFGTRAAEVHLIDRLQTSDDYLMAACEDADVLELHFKEKKSLQDKLMSSVEAGADNFVMRLWHRATTRSLL